MLVGSLGYLLLTQGVDHFFGWWVYTPAEAFIFLAVALVLIPVARGSIRSWVFPRLMQPRRTLIVGSGPRRCSSTARSRRTRSTASRSSASSAPRASDDEGLPEPVIGSAADVADDRRLLRDRPHPDRVLGRQPRGDARPRPHRAPPRRAGLDRAALLRDLHLATPRSTTSRACRSSRCRRSASAAARALLKRTVDVVVSATALLVLAPLLAAVAVAIKLDSKGRRSTASRAAAGSTRPSSIFKFRTMPVGAEQARAEVLHMNEVDGPLFKIKGGDPRVTRVGAFLRKTSIDELPQLWNVLEGRDEPRRPAAVRRLRGRPDHRLGARGGST